MPSNKQVDKLVGVGDVQDAAARILIQLVAAVVQFEWRFDLHTASLSDTNLQETDAVVKHYFNYSVTQMYAAEIPCSFSNTVDAPPILCPSSFVKCAPLYGL